MKSSPASFLPHSVICHANYARFHATNLHVLNRTVKSRMCLWCKGGLGHVVINGHRFTCEHGDYFVLPWNHRVEYFADPVNPFHLAGIHIVPEHDPKHPVEYSIPHSPAHPLFNCSWRHDRPLTGLEGIHHRHLAEDTPLWLLSESIVQLFLRGARHEPQIRLLSQALVAELLRTFGPGEPLRVPPPPLRKALTHIDAHLAHPLLVDDLARLAERSKSGITGLFRAHCASSPIQWINRRRMDRARELLSTTGLPVGEIGAAVGIADPFYFSRLFKKLTGQSPLEYRKETRHF